MTYQVSTCIRRRKIVTKELKYLTSLILLCLLEVLIMSCRLQRMAMVNKVILSSKNDTSVCMYHFNLLITATSVYFLPLISAKKII